MTEFQPLQQKPEPIDDASTGFEHGLDEFMRSHLEDYMSFDSCSSIHRPDDEDDDGDQLITRRGRPDIEGDNLAESSRRRQSRFLSRWASRQAQETIATVERSNNESELSALAGQHTVSMLDSSFLRNSPSPTPRRQGATERPRTQASAILQMWRGLEDEHLLNTAGGRVRERLRQQRVDLNTDLSSSDMLGNRVDDETESWRDVNESRNSTGAWLPDHMGSPNDHGESNLSSRDESPDLEEAERERVRDIMLGWMESGISNHSSNTNHRNNNHRVEWLGDTERERVRIIREWVQMTSQHRGSRGERREDQESLQVDRVPERSVIGGEEVQSEQIRRDSPRLGGRQTLLGFLVRNERDRQRELQGLQDLHSVSDFSHRNRLQSLLRGRFLRNERAEDEERLSSVAASELVQLRQNSVSDSREGFRNRPENNDVGQATGNHSTISSNSIDNSSNNQALAGASESNQHASNDPSPSPDQESDSRLFSDEAIRLMESNSPPEDIHLDEDTNQTAFQQFSRQEGGHVDTNWLQNLVDERHQEAARSANDEDHPQEAHLDWHQDASRQFDGLRSETQSDTSSTRHPVPSRSLTRFELHDEENVYSMELRELLSRRSVSGLLHSDFRENLDELIQSYVERQGETHMELDLNENSPMQILDPPEHDQERQGVGHNDDPDGNNRPPLLLPSPPVPPPRPFWPQASRRTSWSRHNIHRPETEWEVMNDLRVDMARLHQGLNHMQSMLDACMDMQLELQRSVRQEVSAALNRSTDEKGIGPGTSEDGSRWSHVRKGTCCICCDNHIDTLLYRCGHMCTCMKCANELVRTGGKCPLCRAPIFEVIRAYSVL